MAHGTSPHCQSVAGIPLVLRRCTGDYGSLWVSLGTCNLAVDHRCKESSHFGALGCCSLISYQGAMSLEEPGISSWLLPPSWVIAELGTPELGHTDGSGCLCI